MRTIRVVYKAPGQPPEVRDVSDDLSTLQGLVGGYLEHVGGFKGGYSLMCNEEGKLGRLEPNIVGPYDVIVGPLFVTKANDEGEMVSLSKKDIEAVTETLRRVDYGLVPRLAD